MIDKKMFNALSKQSAKSFNDQKALIKKVLAGRSIPCEVCNKNLAFIDKSEKNGQVIPAVIRCEKACTDIELDIV
mgnify:CR=1 FL=1